MGNNETCFFTGHRIIRNGHLDIIKRNLMFTIEELIDLGVSHFIAGGALGFDTIASKAVLDAKVLNPHIFLTLALPCKNQTNGWRQKDIAVYEGLLSSADEIIYVSSEYYDGCMQKRNRYMVNNSSHCVFYMTSPRGGTAYTVKYAVEKGLILHNIMIQK